MLTELRGKGGTVCQPARDGKLRCPLIVRPTSEDVITGHLFQVLGIINPRWWLPDMLNLALGAPRFRKQTYRNLRIELWKNRPLLPRELLPAREGSTQVDVTISWENPPTTVFVEMKYLSDISSGTVNADSSLNRPNDQLIRNIRVGLWECGWLRTNTLFQLPTRDFCMIVMSSSRTVRLVDNYRHADRLCESFNNHDFQSLPAQPFVGELAWSDVSRILKRNQRVLTRSERLASVDLANYLEFKRSRPIRETRSTAEQLELSQPSEPD